MYVRRRRTTTTSPAVRRQSVMHDVAMTFGFPIFFLRRIFMCSPTKQTLYFAEKNSRCHGAKRLLVRSRNGGFVSANCFTCGNSGYVRLSELPPILCHRRDSPMEPGKSPAGNYEYACRSCRVTLELSTMLPHWQDYFKFDGLPAHQAF